VDAAGAEEFGERLEEQEHPRHDDASGDGQQPTADADAGDRENIADGLATAGSRPCRFRAGRTRASAFRCSGR
jgi:hypothetical protein